ncbi:MAG TPA: hypothetical protein VHX15_01600 [Frankiaceae bacterium]|jgi:hypothetical protein|nr:hypothetical protein [Frankiaceae bacterium]
MNSEPANRRNGDGSYQIQVRGQLAARWDSWFDGFTLSRPGDGTTVLTGSVIDQAALLGTLRKIADLGVPLISVTPTDFV